MITREELIAAEDKEILEPDEAWEDDSPSLVRIVQEPIVMDWAALDWSRGRVGMAAA